MQGDFPMPRPTEHGNRVYVLAAFPVVLASSVVWAGNDRQAIVSVGKRATALVEMIEGSGTAFCIHASGYFVTNAHVAGALGRRVRLILNSGETDQRTLEATVVRVNDDDDLALLKCDAAGEQTALSLGFLDTLTETQEVIAFGFPFGKSLGMGGQSPNITVSAGRITSLRRNNGVIDVIQVDAALSPGSSGGPVLDRDGRIIGVVKSGVPGAALNFAIPVSRLIAFLSSPGLSIRPMNPVLVADLTKPVQVDVDLTWFIPTERRPEVTALVLFGKENRAIQLVEVDKSHYRGEFVPVPATDGDRLVNIRVSFKDAHLTAFVENIAITAGTSRLRLHEFETIDLSTRKATTRSGRSTNVLLEEFKSVNIRLGGQSVAVNLASAVRIMVTELETPKSMRIQVSAGVGEIATVAAADAIVTSSRAVANAKPTPPRINTRLDVAEIKPTTVRSTVKRSLGEAAGDIVLAADGRSLLIHLPKKRVVAVFDPGSGTIVREIPVASDIAMAAGVDKLIVVDRSAQLVQRFSLKSYESERVVPLEIPNTVRLLTMGAGSSGPAYLFADKLYALDIDTLLLKAVDLSVGNSQSDMRVPDILAASWDSQVLFACGGGYRYIVWPQEPKVHSINTIGLGGYHLLPSWTGQALLDAQLSLVPETFANNRSYLPIYHSPLFLRIDRQVRRIPNPRNRQMPLHQEYDTLTVEAMGARRPVFAIDLPMSVGSSSYPRPPEIPLARRVHYFGKHGLLVCLPPSGDQLLLMHLDLAQEARRGTGDFLYVVSIPPETVAPGELYQYKVEALTRRNTAVYSLESAPVGMTMGRDGTVTWSAPADFSSEVKVVVRIADGDKSQIFHTFPIRPAGR